MTQEEVFLQRITQNPDDDAPRLVYADWLEERGDADRAEFIRLQCALARAAPDTPASTRLQRRQQRLLREHEAAWRGGLPKLRGVRWGKFWRGFVAGATVTRGPALAAAAPALFAAAPVQRLHIEALDAAGAAGLAAIPPTARLTHLRARPTNEYAAEGEVNAAVPLAHLPQLSYLTELDLDYMGVGPAGAEALAASPYLGRLRVLTLGAGAVGEGVRALLTSDRLASLTVLDLWNNSNITGEVLAAVDPLAVRPRLEVLRLQGSHLRGEGAVLARVVGALPLRELTVSWCVLGDAGAQALAGAAGLSSLRKLDITGNEISAAGMGALLNASWAGGVTDWSFAGPRLDNAAAAVLAAWPGREVLTHLALTNAQVDDIAARTLAASFPWPNLQRLNLSGNQIGEDGVEILAEAVGGRAELCVWQNSIQPDRRRRLRERFGNRLKTDLVVRRPGQRPHPWP